MVSTQSTEVLDALEVTISELRRPEEPCIPHGNRKVRVGLVVAKAHVERRLKLLDPSEFKLQRFIFSCDYCPLDIAGAQHHPSGSLVKAVQRTEVVREPGPEVFGFADVQNPFIRVQESVDPRQFGDF